MRIDYKDDRGQPGYMEFSESITDVELTSVFNGVTFVSRDGERLSVIMRDSGFEIHYYKYEGESDTVFDLGWMSLNNGKAGDICGVPDIPKDPEISSRIQNNVEVWAHAERIVDAVVAAHPLEPYRVGAPLGNGSTMTPAKQRVNMIMNVAEWFLEKEGE